MQQVKALSCDFCGKLYKLKRYAEYHEKLCKLNPENKRPCFDCVHLTRIKTFVELDYGEEKIETLHCKAKSINLYPPQCDIKKNWLDIDNEAMPKECKEHVSYYDTK